MKRRMQLILGGLLLLVSPVPHFAYTYEPRPIEDLIKGAKLIVIGTVEKTFVYEDEGRARAIGRTTIRIQEVIKGEKTSGDTVLVEHFEGDMYSGVIDWYFDLRPIFTPGEQTLLLLSGIGEIYEVQGVFRGKLDIVEGRIAGTDVALADFVEAIKRVDRKETSTLEVDMVPAEYQLEQIKAANEKARASCPTIREDYTYESQSIENMIEEADLIVIGRVETTFIDYGLGKTTIRIQEVIKGEKASGDTIVVEHFEGRGGEVVIYSYYELRPIFTPGEQTLLLLSGIRDIYSVTGVFRGKIDIIEGRIAGTDVALADFVEAIKRVDSKEASTLEVDMVPIEYQLDQIEAANERARANCPIITTAPATSVEPTSWGQLKAAVGSTH